MLFVPGLSSFVESCFLTGIGDEAFFKGLKNYATDPKLLYHTSKSEDFIRHFENVSGKSLKSFFNEWLYSEGIPSDLK